VPAIDCRGLVVRYGALVAVDGLSLSAEHGQVLALLGPNGAGKTSTVETLEGYRRAEAGFVRVLGCDPISQHRALSARIGVMLQHGGVYPTIGTRRVLELFASYYEDAEDPDALLELVGLSGLSATPWRHLSGGEQQRLSMALALVGRPEVVFLDEPTAGVDPEGRLAIRAVIASLRDRETCVLLTTHELPEAERLADEVVIITRGRAVASGSVAELAAAGTRGGIYFSAPPGVELDGLAAALGVDASFVVEEEAGRYVMKEEATPARLGKLAGWLAEHDLPLADLHAGRRSLEEVYLEVTRARSVDEGPDGENERAGEESAAGGADDPKKNRRAPDLGEDQLEVPDGENPTCSSVGPTARVPAHALGRLVAQCAAEVGMTLGRGESLLLTIGIPVVLLVFFSEVHLLPVGTAHPVRFLAPGILALAVMGTSMVNLSIGTGFERSYGVLKRLGSTPLGRPSLLGAKIAAIVVVEVLQVVVLVPVSLALGWHPSAGGAGAAVLVVLLATAGFGGIGLLLAGVLRAEVNLAAANGLWLLFLLVSGMLAPLSKLPGWLEGVAKALPSAALAQALHDSLGLRVAVPAWSWVVLACWAVAAPAAAALTFRWQ